MKKYLKETWHMYVIAFVFCFMLFLYEPILMFINNPSDFWFGIGTMIKLSSLLFIIVLIIVLIIFNVIYFLNKEKSKKIFKIFTVAMFVIFICSYIQGNFLVGNLPVLDGTKINWSSYKLDWIISALLWIIIIGVTVFIIKKVSLKNAVKYFGFVGLGIFVMLSLSLSTSYLSNKEGTKEKNFVPIMTYKNINKYSTDKNFIILLLDCVDSKKFMERLNDDKSFDGIFKDFTYYEDMMSAHPYTAESIPLILTGKYYKNDGLIYKWSTEAYKESSLFDLIEKNGYELNVYENDLYYDDESITRIANVYNSKETLLSNIRKMRFFKQEIKYIMFRYLPAFFKKYSSIEDLSFTTSYLIDSVEIQHASNDTSFDNRIFDPDNYEMFKIIQNAKIDKDSTKNFKFIHLDGAHVPWTYDKNYKSLKNGKYEDEIDASITLTKAYLNMLKENGIYDNSVIIIMADHGFSTEENGSQRRNPLFLVKGLNEKHNKMNTSNKPVHFIDLNSLYFDLISGKKTNQVFKNVPDTRTRVYLHYTLDTKYKMVEYETEGKTWEVDKIRKTGKVYTK